MRNVCSFSTLKPLKINAERNADVLRNWGFEPET